MDMRKFTQKIVKIQIFHQSLISDANASLDLFALDPDEDLIKESHIGLDILKENLDTEFDISRKWASQTYAILKKRQAKGKVAGV